MKVLQIRIDFYVTPEIERYVFVYLIENDKECWLIDSGVSGSEEKIENVIKERGHDPSDLKAIFLTHAHPDHMGTAAYFREKYGTLIYASKGEKAWIEDIDLQFRERPIPNFYNLAGKSCTVDKVVKDGDIIALSNDITIEVLGTPGHSVDEISYQMGDMIFVGDSIPVRGDIPIFINLEEMKNSLEKLGSIKGVKIFYPAWDQYYLYEVAKSKIDEAKKIIYEIEGRVKEMDNGNEISELISQVCEALNISQFTANPLFKKTIECCRKGRN